MMDLIPVQGRFRVEYMRTSLTQAYLKYRRSLLATIFNVVKDNHVAEDLAQETYLRAYLANRQATIAHPGAFLHKTARNIALDHERRRKIENRHQKVDIEEFSFEEAPIDTLNAEQVLLEKERLKLFLQILEKMPDRARIAWKLAHIDHWSYQKIANHLSVSKNTVYNDIKLVMGHFHDALRHHEDK